MTDELMSALFMLWIFTLILWLFSHKFLSSVLIPVYLLVLCDTGLLSSALLIAVRRL
jgi:hypothetical protein